MQNKLIKITVTIILLAITVNLVNAYNIDSPGHVHQYITNESKFIWKLVPSEIKDHLSTSLNQQLDSNYDQGDDVITGSGEEDKPVTKTRKHFWQLDNPKSGKYNDGLLGFDSSYERAKNLFKEEVVPLYLKGDKDEAYYWLGRIAHLLEDATELNLETKTEIEKEIKEVREGKFLTHEQLKKELDL